MNRQIRQLFFISLAMFVASCANMGAVSKAVNAYHASAARVELGQSKSEVLRILQPTQVGLSARQQKQPEVYMKDDKRMEIYFFRSQSFADGLVTDDEFTPYLFEEDKLVGIGWTVIGGPKTQAQTRDDDHDVHFHGRVFYY